MGAFVTVAEVVVTVVDVGTRRGGGPASAGFPMGGSPATANEPPRSGAVYSFKVDSAPGLPGDSTALGSLARALVWFEAQPVDPNATAATAVAAATNLSETERNALLVDGAFMQRHDCNRRAPLDARMLARPQFA